jgi:hypothetical protein
MFDQDNSPPNQGNTASDLMDFTATATTLTDGDSTYDGIETPSPTDDGIDVPTTSDLEDNGVRGTPVSSITLPELARTPSAPDPTVLLHEIQQAAEDVSLLCGRFGYKMAETLRRHAIKTTLFADDHLLRLPCLKYADNFTCRVTRAYGTQPISYTSSAPLLWWLWDELLHYLKSSAWKQPCKLEFTPARQTDIALPYTISIKLSYKNTNDIIELTASYGGIFHERRIFDAPMANFFFPEKKKYGKSIIATLNIDRHAYKKEGSLADTFDYLVPRAGSIWRHAMEAFPTDKEEALVVALVGTCQAEDDHFYMSKSQAQQCLNLIQRFPVDAREYIIEERLLGKRNGPYSRIANLPPGPKD